MADPSLGERRTIFRTSGLTGVFAFTLVYAAIVVLAPTFVLRIPLGYVMLVFAPGYALGAALFVRRPLLPPAAEFAVAVGLSVVFNGLVGLLLLLGRAGLSIDGLLIADISAASVGLAVKLVARDAPGSVGVGAAVRRELRLPGVRPEYRKTVYVLLVASLIALAGVAYVGLAQPPVSPTTSIALSGPDGTSSSLPKVLRVGEVGLAVVAITDGYSAGLIALNVSATFQGQTATNLTALAWVLPLALSSQTESILPLSLTSGGETSVNVTFEFTQPGAYSLAFALQAAQGASLQVATIGVQVTT